MRTFANFIGNTWRPPSSGRYTPNINPARPDEALGLFPESGTADVDSAVRAAREAFDTWSNTPAPERGALLYRFADLLEKHSRRLGETITKEQGKVLGEAIGEVSRAASEARFMAGEAVRLYGETLPSARLETWVQRVREPLGVIAAITPWNFPIVAPVRKIAPALACGNTVILKPAQETPWCAVALIELLEEAGLPAGVVNLVTGDGPNVGAHLVASPNVSGVTFTGSTEVGRQIYERSARRLARVQLELGGKNAAIVINPYDYEEAAQEIVDAAFACSGQRCTALSRVIVHRQDALKLVAALCKRVETLSVGDGFDRGCQVGPLINQKQLERVERYVELARDEGADIRVGGSRLTLPNNGFFYQPTVISGLQSGSRLAREEIFGPVLPILTVDSLEEAAQIHNDTAYGLAVSIFSRDIRTAKSLADKAKVGMVHINHGTASQAHVPFGGIKGSGQGPYSIGRTVQDFFMTDKVVYFA